MKKTKLIILLLINVYATANSQKFTDNNRYNKWLFGYQITPGPQIELGIIDFDSGVPDISLSYTDSSCFAATYAGICDTAGTLLFYTNGLKINDSTHHTMTNGDTLAPGIWTAENYYLWGLNLPQGAIILEDPIHENNYWVIYSKIEYDLNLGGIYGPIFSCRVDMNTQLVTDKNVIVVNDTMDTGSITACRHANGRDWWILAPRWQGNYYHKLLLSSSGLLNMGEETVGQDYRYILGQAAFSPNGSMYCRYGAFDYENSELDIYDFDRCTGTLTNPRQLVVQDSGVWCGVAISSNSRYLYCSGHRFIFQFDLWAVDIFGSMDTVGVFDGYLDGGTIPVGFQKMQLGPDNKIYVASSSTVPYLHVIEYPNLRGDSCQVVQRAITLPTSNGRTLPNFPYYHLGPLDGSTCDTLGLDNPLAIQQPQFQEELPPVIQAYPNPVQGPLTIRYSGLPKAGVYVLYDVHGRALRTGAVPPGSGKVYLSTEGVPAGVYFLRVACEGEEVMVMKVLVE